MTKRGVIRKGVRMGLEPAQLEAVAGLFGVLSEGSRLRILQVLEEGPASVGEIVERVGMKQANVSKQLGILMGAGVVGREQRGNFAVYSIAMPVVFELCEIVCAGVAAQAAKRAEILRG